MEPLKCSCCGEVIWPHFGESTIGPGQPTKMSSCPRDCPNCNADQAVVMKCCCCSGIIELDSGEWAIEPSQPTKGSSCPRYCPYCGEAGLVMEPYCYWCDKVIELGCRELRSGRASRPK